ncbi:hypothetical protein FZC79_09400 [Rossellomorea vietnamensis]|uniref:Uncharacterized protein n=1 Tax=Rossellomorea vietnamensis TaxID=218284 RepID=A0A5D4KF41_9BACI|nr:hypothetical protein [Rossellomorea vietnamensis]TYR75822.1 hypothetical protein FZC79_09400 [Rossellomorea vietnamensis]
MNISLITEGQTEAAKNVVLQGFKERFGVIIDGLNPDLDDITGYYKENKFFYVGHFELPTTYRPYRSLEVGDS